MNYFDAIIQGIIQGLTEFLPVSSSGHLSLYQHFTGNSGEAGGTFAILLHFGTLLAVFVVFREVIIDMIIEFFKMLGDIFKGKFDWKNMNGVRRMILLMILSLVPLWAFFFIRDFYNSLAEDSDIVVEGLCFLLTAALLIISGKCVKTGGKNASNMSWKDALAVGITQGIAPLPGLSRSGSTISVGLIMGLSREYAVAFSFIMGMPVVLAANILEIPDLIKENTFALSDMGPALVGMLVALAVGIAAIKAVQYLVKNDKFHYFACYLIVIGVITTGIGVFEHITGNLVTF